MTTILVIEDEAAIRQNILDLLEAEGFDAEGAENGRVGLERIFGKTPDLVVCDVTMPELDGHAVLRAVRADPSTQRLPFVFLTAKADRADVRAGMNLGADDFLAKPFSRVELLDAIRTRLRRSADVVVDDPSVPLPAAIAAARRKIEPGSTFGRYRVEHALGEGGMGQVYRAHDVRLQRAVALKILRQELAGSPADVEKATARLLTEARAVAALRHPNVVTIFDVGRMDGVPYLAMEFVAGRGLHDACDGQPWSVVVGWLVQVAEALSAAHAAGIVHRDVKPENVMVRDDGTVVVLDFGIARRSDIASGTSQEMIGTVGYMAPEQIDNAAIDGRADQFGFAIMAYELLSGEFPWGTPRNVVAMLAAVATTEPKPLAALAPALPAPIAAAITRAMSKSRDDRFSSMDEIRDVLAPFATPPSGREGATTGTPRRPAIDTAPASTLPAEGARAGRVALADTLPFARAAKALDTAEPVREAAPPKPTDASAGLARIVLAIVMVAALAAVAYLLGSKLR